MGERREFKRYMEKTRAVINCYTRAGSLHMCDHLASTFDLSMGGMRLVTHQFLDVGTDLVVSLDLSSVNKCAQLLGRVKWVEKRQGAGLYDLGIQFLHSSDPVADIAGHDMKG